MQMGSGCERERGKKWQRIRIKSWIIITNSYIIKTERWTMNEWMDECCAVQHYNDYFYYIEGLRQCCYHMEINSFHFTDHFWFMIDCKKAAVSSIIPYFHFQRDLTMTFCTKKCTLKCHINYEIFFHWQLHPTENKSALLHAALYFRSYMIHT